MQTGLQILITVLHLSICLWMMSKGEADYSSQQETEGLPKLCHELRSPTVLHAQTRQTDTYFSMTGQRLTRGINFSNFSFEEGRMGEGFLKGFCTVNRLERASGLVFLEPG